MDLLIEHQHSRAHSKKDGPTLHRFPVDPLRNLRHLGPMQFHHTPSSQGTLSATPTQLPFSGYPVADPGIVSDDKGQKSAAAHAVSLLGAKWTRLTTSWWAKHYKMMSVCFPDLPASRLRYYVTHYEPGTLLYTHGNRLLGGFVVIPRRNEPDTLWLELVYVDPDFRGLGLGRKLVAEVERFAILRGFRRVGLAVLRSNVPAIALYNAAGFQRQTSASPGEWLFYKDLISSVAPIAREGFIRKFEGSSGSQIYRIGRLCRISARKLLFSLVTSVRYGTHA